MISMTVLKDASEIIHYDSPEIPYALQERMLSQYSGMKALAHWHDDIEFIHIFEGEMYYDINGKQILLQKGDSIIVNSHQLHYGFSNHNEECIFTVLLFHPELLKANISLYQKYVQPIISCNSLEYWHFSGNRTQKKEIENKLFHLFLQRQFEKPFDDYDVLGFIYNIWNYIYQESDPSIFANTLEQDPDIHLQKKMVTYINKHYSENIVLEDIASAANISRSKCCKIFKKYLNQSPISYLNDYRMNLSCALLRNTSYSVTQIALACGYNHLSYFSKMFLKKHECTPQQYRKKNHSNSYLSL